MTGCFFLSFFEGVGERRGALSMRRAKFTYFVGAFGEKDVIERT